MLPTAGMCSFPLSGSSFSSGQAEKHGSQGGSSSLREDGKTEGKAGRKVTGKKRKTGGRKRECVKTKKKRRQKAGPLVPDQKNLTVCQHTSGANTLSPSSYTTNSSPFPHYL